MKPLFSIITVVYNSESLIERTILSVIEQTYKNLEYIIIDGGSSDGTLHILKKYSDRISFWISEPDKGIYDAMNKGLSRAKGEFVWFLNSGDTIDSSETLSLIARKNTTADVLFGETMLVDSRFRNIGIRSELTTRKLPKKLTYKSMVKGMVVSHQSFICRKEIAGFYNTHYRCSADIDWVITALKNSSEIFNCQMVISKYLIGGFSIKNKEKCLWERFDIYIKHFGLFSTLWGHGVLLIKNIVFFLKGRVNY